MITIFSKDGSGAIVSAEGLPENLPAATLWIDLNNPTAEEEKFVESKLEIEILTREEIEKNQVLHRFYLENDVAYMSAAIITKLDAPYPLTSAVTFILTPGCLVTLRYISPTSFKNVSQRLLRNPPLVTGGEILEELLEEIITRIAYNSENVVGELDKLSHDIFGVDAFEASKKSPSQMMKAILQRLGACGDLNSKISESVHSLSRLLTFLRHLHSKNGTVNHRIETLLSDIAALTQQTNFLSDKITFQLDATLGMISVEQNMIVKIFSIVAVFFMPPTLLSSIYGMNFTNMPELHWALGYPFAIAMMLLFAIGPFVYFRKKGWL